MEGEQSSFKALFGGTSSDASHLLTTGLIASTRAPIHPKITPHSSKSIPSRVVWVARRADPTEGVDGKAKDLGLISIDSSTLALTLLERGRQALATAAERDEAMATVTNRLEEFSFEFLGNVLTQTKPPEPIWLQEDEARWVLTHGVWLLCSSTKHSHDTFANYLMSVQWWKCVGHSYAVKFCGAVSEELVDGRDSFQCRLVGRMNSIMTPSEGPELNLFGQVLREEVRTWYKPGRMFNADFIQCIPDSADVFKPWLLEMNAWERRVYGPTYAARDDAAYEPSVAWEIGLQLWAGVGPLNVSGTVQEALKKRGMSYKDGAIPELGVDVPAHNIATIEEGKFADWHIALALWAGLKAGVAGKRLGKDVLDELEKRDLTYEGGRIKELDNIKVDATHLTEWIREKRAPLASDVIAAGKISASDSFGSLVAKHDAVEALQAELATHPNELGYIASDIAYAMTKGVCGPKVKSIATQPIPERQLNAHKTWNEGLESVMGLCQDGASAALRVALVLDPAIDVNMRNPTGFSALDCCSGGRIEAAKVLLKAGAVDGRGFLGWSTLHLACRNGQTAFVEWLLKETGSHSVNVRDDLHRTPLDWACLEGHRSTAETLIAAGASIHAPGIDEEGPLFHAIWGNHGGTVRWLQGLGAQIHPDQVKAAVQYAFLRPANPDWAKETADLVLPASVDRAALYRPTLFAKAVWLGRVDSVQEALSLGVDVNKPVSRGRTPLMFIRKSTQIAKLLVRAGANLNARDDMGVSVLQWAKYFAFEAVVKVLEAAGAVE